MTTRIEALRRLADISQERIQIAVELAPFYQAANRLRMPDGDVNYEMLENHPTFRPLWLKDQELRNEWTKVILTLA